VRHPPPPTRKKLTEGSKSTTQVASHRVDGCGDGRLAPRALTVEQPKWARWYIPVGAEPLLGPCRPAVFNLLCTLVRRLTPAAKPCRPTARPLCLHPGLTAAALLHQTASDMVRRLFSRPTPPPSLHPRCRPRSHIASRHHPCTLQECGRSLFCLPHARLFDVFSPAAPQSIASPPPRLPSRLILPALLHPLPLAKPGFACHPRAAPPPGPTPPPPLPFPHKQTHVH